jgi:hypothetical protein
MIEELLIDAGRAGVKKSVDEVMPLFRDYMDDIECDKLIKRMDDSGIDATVVNVVDNVNFGFDNERIMRINGYCSRAAAKHPGRIIPLAGIDPRRPDAPALFRRCIEELNMKGLKWHPDDGYYPNSEESYAVLEVAGVGKGQHSPREAGTALRGVQPQRGQISQDRGVVLPGSSLFRCLPQRTRPFNRAGRDRYPRGAGVHPLSSNQDETERASLHALPPQRSAA